MKRCGGLMVSCMTGSLIAASPGPAADLDWHGLDVRAGKGAQIVAGFRFGG
jgi:hypothetical protein